MNVEEIASELEARIRLVCNAQARYRVLWVVGKPRSGKTALVRSLCTSQGWRYINFTLDEGFLDSLIGREEHYQPEDFLAAFHRWCADMKEEMVIFDEIEPLLALWNWQQQELFIRQVGRDTRLPVGVVFVTRMYTLQQLRKKLFDMQQDHLYEIL